MGESFQNTEDETTQKEKQLVRRNLRRDTKRKRERERKRRKDFSRAEPEQTEWRRSPTAEAEADSKRRGTREVPSIAGRVWNLEP